MKHTGGDENALLFLSKMARRDFTPSDCVVEVLRGTNQYVANIGVATTSSGWSQRLKRLKKHGWLSTLFSIEALYTFTKDGEEVVACLEEEK